jgi:arginine utilization protein RocB
MRTLSLQSSVQMLNLLNDLVSIGSVSLSEAEKQFPLRVEEYLKKIPYFSENPAHIIHHPTSDGRSFLTALYKHEEAVKTVVMISHFDVVNVEDYGELQHLAFNPIELTKALFDHVDELPEDVRNDLESNDWIFGRGTMDMKCGLVQHLSLLEKASSEEWKVNLLLLTIPDEEVNSVGMREAVPKLLEISEAHQLNYTLFLNSEPMFTQIPGDESYYFYTGSIGKIMPAALCFGKETHVGEPFSGLNAAWMSSVLSQEIEWNEVLCETVNGKQCPPPTVLLQRDLKKEYSTKIPYRSVSLYNMFLMQKNPAEVMKVIREITESAVKKMKVFIEEKFRKFQIESNQSTQIRVLSYEELKEYASKKTSEETITELENSSLCATAMDSREQSIEIVDKMAILCQELAPMIVLFYAPPYYPAVSSDDHPIIQALGELLINYTKEQYGQKLIPIEYFNGISDLSYAALQAPMSDMNKYHTNLPGGQRAFSIPFEAMSNLTAPVINVGPFGKDAHKKTERLHVPFAFEQLPKMLEHLILTHQKQ